MDESYELEQDKQSLSVLSLSTLESIKMPDAYKYGSCK